MKQIFNWTIGSFFRTIGRTIAFLVMGGIIYYFLSISGIDFKLNELFFTKIKASGIASPVYQEKFYYQSGSQLSNSSKFGDGVYSVIIEGGNNIWLNSSHAWSGNGLTIPYTQQYKEVVFQVAFDKPTAFTVNDNVAVTSYFTRNGNLYAATLCKFEGYSSLNYEIDWEEPRIYTDYYYLVCPLPVYSGSNIFLSRLTVQASQTNSNQLFHINRNINLILNDNYIIQQEQQGTTNAINNQSQQQLQQHNETMQTITDTNTTSDVSSASDYFSNTSEDTPSGLVSAVTSPLRVFDNAIQGISSPLCFTLNSKQTCIPDGSIIWGRSYGQGIHWFIPSEFNPKNAFISFFNLVVGGFLCYKMLISMMRVYNDVVDPTTSKIEVMKL